ncbi:MAG: hypothetical protein ACI4GV_08045 [Acutalibacteraceae bacterium]
MEKNNNSIQRENDKSTALSTAYDKLETFLSNVSEVDKKVSEKIKELKDDFYNKYKYLKPDCEKNFWDKAKDVVKAIWKGICNLANDFKNFIVDVGKWCQEHWKAVVTAVLVIVAVAALIVLACIPGGGIIASIIAGAAWGAISGALIGGVMGGIQSAQNGGSFWEGFENGAFDGAISGAIGGAISGGFGAFFGKSATLMQSVIRGALSESVSSGISNMCVTALDFYIQNGTLENSFGEILKSGLIGTITGGIMGSAMGAVKFKIDTRSPANKAKNWQGTENYAGVDDYENIKLNKGQEIYVLESDYEVAHNTHSGYATTGKAVESSGLDSKVLSEGLQIKPYSDGSSGVATYRPQVTKYTINADNIDAAFGSKTIANSQYGKGGLPQYFISNFDEQISKGNIIRGSSLPLHNLEIPVEALNKMLELSRTTYHNNLAKIMSSTIRTNAVISSLVSSTTLNLK